MSRRLRYLEKLEHRFRNAKDPAGLDFEPHPDDIKRFLDKVRLDPDTNCWIWTACKDDKGYGQFSMRRKSCWAHRWSYAVFRRPLIPGFTLEHKCHNASCVNPWHLELMTNVENSKKNHRKAENNGASEVPF